jgi:hypothetical protein
MLGSTHVCSLLFLSFFLSCFFVTCSELRNSVKIMSKSEFYTSVILEDNSNTHIKSKVNLTLYLIKRHPLKIYQHVLLYATLERGMWQSRWNSTHCNFNHFMSKCMNRGRTAKTKKKFSLELNFFSAFALLNSFEPFRARNLSQLCIALLHSIRHRKHCCVSITKYGGIILGRKTVVLWYEIYTTRSCFVYGKARFQCAAESPVTLFIFLVGLLTPSGESGHNKVLPIPSKLLIH